MRTASANPTGNALPPSTKDKAIIDAIELSGYPLQGVVTSKLLNLGFSAAEEWGYIDSDTNENRALDVNGWKEIPADDQKRIRGDITLLIECKRSVHPYVFFKKVADVGVPGFPVVASCPRIGLQDNHKSTSIWPLSRLVCSNEMSFLQEPPLCSVFSQADLQKDKAKLSGEEPYKSIILPLTKVVNYIEDQWRGRGVYIKMLLLVCVVNSAMILVEAPNKTADPVLTPWIRIARQEAILKNTGWDGSHRHYAIDVVHVDFFDSFVRDKLMPFASEYFNRASELSGIIGKGGLIEDLHAWKWGDKITPSH